MPGLRACAPPLSTRNAPAPLAHSAFALAGLILACNTSSPAGAGEPAAARTDAAAFVRTRGTRFVRDGQPLPVIGMNYWAAATDCRTEAGRARVARELDRLSAVGVNVLRILAASEGPDGAPWRITPSLQPAPGTFSAEGLAGLDWLMGELARRRMSGVFILNNFWFWSGGMAQYLSWARGVPIPYPLPERHGGWARYEDFTAEFFGDARARALFEAALRTIIPRYRDSPAVFAWELANEPHARGNVPAFSAWLDETARLVHTLDPNHIITTGSEGNTPDPRGTGLDVTRDHASAAIDFVSIHIWPENWGWTRTGSDERPFEQVTDRARRYLDDHVRAAAALGKPALLLETGLPRDGSAFTPSTPVHLRDRYLQFMFDTTLASVESGGPLAGVFPWAWSGEAVPQRPGEVAESTPYTGDPPHERQGWYGIYASDTSTLDLIRRHAARFQQKAR